MHLYCGKCRRADAQERARDACSLNEHSYKTDGVNSETRNKGCALQATPTRNCWNTNTQAGEMRAWRGV